MGRYGTHLLVALIAGMLTGPGWGRVEAVDDSGHRIRLEAPARRIVALSPHLTELLFQAGAGAWIVGAAAYSDYPSEALAIARVGDARGLDIEAIVQKRPDLVVAWTSGNSRKAVERLRRLRLTVFESEPTALDDIPRTLLRLGELVGTTEVARAGAAAFRTRLASLVASYGGDAPIPVFYQIWDRPLLTVNGRHIITQILRTCGAQNVFAHLPQLTGAPSREAVLLAQPAVIVVASRAADALAPWEKWPQARAVRDRRLFAVDPDILHRPTLRVLDGVAELCAKLHSGAPR